MVYSSFYNSKNEVLVITTNSTNFDTYEKKDNIVYFYNQEKKIIGINIFEKMDINDGVCQVPNKYKYLIEEFENPEFGFVYGLIEGIKPHPKSEKLKICSINVGLETMQIVCGASNCTDNKIAIVAKVGATMPSGMNIKPSKVIDIESSGMLCSLYELGHIKEAKKGIALYDIGEKNIGNEVSQ